MSPGDTSSRHTRRQAVAAGAPGLLVVRFQRSGRRQVRDAAHVGPVDAHAERVGGDHHLQLARHEGVLHPVALLARHAGVVRFHRPAAPRQALRLLFGAAAGRRVHDGGAGAGFGSVQGLHQHAVHVPIALPFAQHLRRAQREIGPREAMDELRRAGGQAEAFQDLVAHHRRGSGGACQHARFRQQPHQFVELQVVGAEVVPPGTDAVRLVDRHQRARDTGERGAQPVARQSFGRDVDQLERARGQRANAPAHLVLSQGRRQVGSRHPLVLQRRHLVVHQRDQRRDHDRRAGQQCRRKLVGEALAAAGGRHQQQPARFEQRLYRFPLPGPKRTVSEAPQPSVHVDSVARRRGPATGDRGIREQFNLIYW